jgi:uncharacterized protein with FMN-binding domain
MKRKHVILLVALLVVAGLVVAFVTMLGRTNDALEEMMAEEITEINLETVEDGTYQGTYGSFPVRVDVTVTVSSHMITTIVIDRHDNGQGKDAEVIVNDIITAQSLDVDLITGSSYSSKAILLAVMDALNG